MTQAYGDLVEAITNARFRPVRVREGYDMAAVDALLDRLVAALGRGEPVGPVVDAARLAHVRLREGYDTGEVDAFLAEVRRTAPGASMATAPGAAVADQPAVPEQRSRLGRLLGRG
ncbi:MAG TPA: DivIVA domain-containing protein [Marmoricola sp.]|nr:DivIVA domain-containing protein [Marmoricola sp.]